ncbi:MAG TPA: TIGR02206 family membrane protein [Candidatus Dormibacteraeota bacterium]|nr:TIGR02206 family membrane protein [Candidatus Dormibacteraeota bacterium]
MSLVAGEHLAALVVIAAAAPALVVAARRSPGAWLKVLALVLAVDEVSWWVYLALGGGLPGERAQPLPLQLCDAAVLVAAAALWTRAQPLVEVTYFWALAGSLQALLTPDLPHDFPSYPYFQYYLAHGGTVAAALILVVGLRITPRRWAVVRVAAITVAYTALVFVADTLTGADYMFLRGKPDTPSLLDYLGPWPWYLVSAAGVAALLFAVLDAPFRLLERRAESLR